MINLKALVGLFVILGLCLMTDKTVADVFCQRQFISTATDQSRFDLSLNFKEISGQVTNYSSRSESVQNFAKELDFLLQDLAPSKKIKIKLLREIVDTDSGLMFGIQLGRSFLEVGTKGDTTEKEFKALFSHEYAHLAFLTHFSIRFNEQFWSRERIENTRPIEELEILNKISRLQEIAYAHEELFADLVAVLYMKTPGAMSQVLRIPKQSPYYIFGDNRRFPPTRRQSNPDGSRPRDFDSLTSFKNWQHERIDNVYSIFDPVRAAFYKLIEDKISLTNQKMIIQSFLSAVQEHAELIDESKRPNPLSGKESAESLNKEFFKILVSHLKKNKII